MQTLENRSAVDKIIVDILYLDLLTTASVSISDSVNTLKQVLKGNVFIHVYIFLMFFFHSKHDFHV